MAPISDHVREILAKPTIVHLATINQDGSPQVTPIWIETDGDVLVLNTVEGRVKHRNMVRDARVGLSLVDPDDPHDMVSINGRVVSMTTEGAEEHIDKLANKYMGVDHFPNWQPDWTRVIVRIEPERIVG